MSLYLVDNGEKVALVRVEHPRTHGAFLLASKVGVDGASVTASLVEEQGEALVLWVQGEPIGLRE